MGTKPCQSASEIEAAKLLKMKNGKNDKVDFRHGGRCLCRRLERLTVNCPRSLQKEDPD